MHGTLQMVVIFFNQCDALCNCEYPSSFFTYLLYSDHLSYSWTTSNYRHWFPDFSKAFGHSYSLFQSHDSLQNCHWLSLTACLFAWTTSSCTARPRRSLHLCLAAGSFQYLIPSMKQKLQLFRSLFSPYSTFFNAPVCPVTILSLKFAQIAYWTCFIILCADTTLLLSG